MILCSLLPILSYNLNKMSCEKLSHVMKADLAYVECYVNNVKILDMRQSSAPVKGKLRPNTVSLQSGNLCGG